MAALRRGNLTGWTSNGTLNPFGTTYGTGMDGTYWHWLAGYETPITTSQTVTGLVAGTTYNLTFLMASEYTNRDSLNLSIDGGPGTLFTAPNYNGNFWDNWVSQSYSFVATGSSATIQFDTVGLNKGGYDVGLDKVSLLAEEGAVPEPSTWAMMLLGFGAIGTAVRRRPRQFLLAKGA